MRMTLNLEFSRLYLPAAGNYRHWLLVYAEMEPRPSRLLGKALFQLSCVPKHVELVYMVKLAGLLSRL